MPGGRFDSSRTRVAPFFDALLARDPSGMSWLPDLMALPEHGSPNDASVLGRLVDSAWGENERGLPAPASLLSWLVRNLKCPSSMKEEDLRPERRDLVNGEEERIGGCPDAYLATSDAIVVIEGRRTEAGPTRSTTGMPVQSQMLRHLDAAHDLAGHRAVYGFFMVEGPEDGSIPEVWREAAERTLDRDLVERSLPHRSREERDRIVDAFLGVTTWQRACQELDIPAESLPNEVPV